MLFFSSEAIRQPNNGYQRLTLRNNLASIVSIQAPDANLFLVRNGSDAHTPLAPGKRPVSKRQLDYGAAQQKGQCMLDLLDRRETQATTEFRSYNDLATWGWVPINEGTGYPEPLRVPFQDLGLINRIGNSMQRVTVQQILDSRNDKGHVIVSQIRKLSDLLPQSICLKRTI